MNLPENTRERRLTEKGEWKVAVEQGMDAFGDGEDDA